MAKVIVTGWKEIDMALAKLETKLQGKVLRGALRAGAQRVQAAAIQNIISSPSIDEGKLARCMKVRAMPRSRVRVGMEVITKGAAHANIVEYGAKHMPAEPFLRPAGYKNREYIGAMLVKDVNEAAQSPAWKFIKTAARYIATRGKGKQAQSAAKSITAKRREVTKILRKRAKAKEAKK